MQGNSGNEVQDRSAAAAAQRPQSEALSLKLIKCPFEVRIDGEPHDRFYDLRDAMASGRVAKLGNPKASVVVVDVTTGKLMIEVEA